MRLTIRKTILGKALVQAAKLAPAGTPDLRVEAAEGQLILTVQSEIGGAVVIVPNVEITRSGCCAVILSTLNQIVATMRCENVHLFSDGNSLILLADALPDSRLSILLSAPLPAAMLPSPKLPRLRVDTGELSALYESVRFAAGKKAKVSEGHHYRIDRLHLEATQKSLTLTATDEVHLATGQVKAEGQEDYLSAVIPVSFVRFWVAECQDRQTRLTKWKGSVYFEAEGLVSWACDCDGSYPAWRLLTLINNPHALTLPVAALLERWTIALAAAGRDDPVIELHVGENLMRLSAHVEAESLSEWMVSYSGPEVTLRLPGKRLKQYLESLTCDYVRLEFKDAKLPVLCHPVNPGTLRSAYLVVPVEGEQ